MDINEQAVEAAARAMFGEEGWLTLSESEKELYRNDFRRGLSAAAEHMGGGTTPGYRLYSTQGVEDVEAAAEARGRKQAAHEIAVLTARIARARALLREAADLGKPNHGQCHQSIDLALRVLDEDVARAYAAGQDTTTPGPTSTTAGRKTVGPPSGTRRIHVNLTDPAGQDTSGIKRVHAFNDSLKEIAKDAGGILRCETCFTTGPVLNRYWVDGWPRCCGHSMRWWTRAQIERGEMSAAGQDTG